MINYNNKKYKIVVVTPAGRKKYMEILLYYILMQQQIVDEYRIWVNTKNEDDITWFKELQIKYPSLITLEFLPPEIEVNGNLTICDFFKNTIDEDTIYLRLDDDIVWMEKDFVEKIIKFRIDNPDYFLIFGNIINNSVIDHIHQKNGINYSKLIKNDCLCKNGWGDSSLCEEKHRCFLSRLPSNIDAYKFEKYETIGQRISINAICWFGKDLKEFSGIVDKQEEPWLSQVAPGLKNKKVCVNGNALCSHYSFWVQREHMDKTDILEKYKELIQR